MDASASFVGLIFLILIAAALIGGVVGIVLLVRGSSRGSGSGLCGKCGYSVTGLTHFECPECGSDLREVGITNRTGGGGQRGLGIALIIIAVLAVGCTCFGALFAANGRSMTVAPMPAPPPAVQSSSETATETPTGVGASSDDPDSQPPSDRESEPIER